MGHKACHHRKRSDARAISERENLFINKEARFIDSNRVLIALMSNELILIDIKSAQKALSSSD